MYLLTARERLREHPHLGETDLCVPSVNVAQYDGSVTGVFTLKS